MSDPNTAASVASGEPEWVKAMVKHMEEFDPSDGYHDGDPERPGYHQAIDRCIALVKGEIEDWTTPKHANDSGHRRCPACGWGLHGTVCGKCDRQQNDSNRAGEQRG